MELFYIMSNFPRNLKFVIKKKEDFVTTVLKIIVSGRIKRPKCIKASFRKRKKEKERLI